MVLALLARLDSEVGARLLLLLRLLMLGRRKGFFNTKQDLVADVEVLVLLLDKGGRSLGLLLCCNLAGAVEGGTDQE